MTPTIVNLIAFAGLFILIGSQLPASTQQVTQESNGSGSDGKLPPRLTKLVKEGDIVHVRSELTILPNRDNSMGLLGAFAILDEWLQPGDFYRVKSLGLEQNFDYLIYLKSEEFFDLSTQWRCPCEPPSQTQQLGQKSSSLNWISSNLLASNKNISFYGALSLWLLAEQLETREMPLQKRVIEPSSQLPVTDDNNNNNDSNKSPVNSTGRPKGQQQQWMVEDPDNKQYPWFRLHFNSFNEFGSQELELDKVETINWQRASDGSSSIRSQLIASSVINYKITRSRFKTSTDEEIFLIPIGYGCRRNQKARDAFRFDSIDRTVFGRLVPFEFDYTAILELVQAPPSDSMLEQGQVTTTTRPVDLFHSGWFGRCTENLFGSPTSSSVQVNIQRRHHLNGTSESWREIMVHDGYLANTVQRRTLDHTTGVCRIGRGLEPIVPGELFRLSFQASGALEGLEVQSLVSEPIGFNDELIELDDNDSYEFERLQTVAVDDDGDGDNVGSRRQLIVYESRRPNITLNSRLSGEGSIVRTYTRTPATRSRRNYTFHDGLKIDVFLVDKARLTVQIDNLRASDGLDIVRQAKASECYEDETDQPSWDERRFQTAAAGPRLRRGRLFELQFEPQQGQTIGWLEFDTQRDKIESWLYRRLLFSPGEVPVMQLGSELVQMDFRRSDSVVLVKFKLLEPLAALHYFEQLESFSIRQTAAVQHERLVSSVHDCSDLCEYQARPQVGDCLAFSYCDNHLCKTIDALSLPYESDNGQTMTHSRRPLLELLEPHFELNQVDSCSLYYAPSGRTSRPKYVDDIVAELRGHLQVVAAADDAVGDSFGFYLNQDYQLGGDKVHFVARQLRELHETTRWQSRQMGAADTMGQQLDIDSTYAILRPNYELLVQGIKQSTGLQVTSRLVQAADQAECLRLCSLNRCQLVSHCQGRQGGLCTMISNVTDWLEYSQLSSSAQLGRRASDSSGCTLFSEDFLARGGYSYFANTREPNRSNLIRATTATNLIECAAMCELYQRDRASAAMDCLSFDYCFKVASGEDDHHQPEEPAGYCYLHRLHLVMDDFDESIFSQQVASSEHEKVGGDSRETRPLRCSHYSKSLLADFKVLHNKQFVSHETITYSNVQLDNCALICRRSDTCLALEFCRANKLTIMRDTCYIKHFNSTTTTTRDDLQEMTGGDESNRMEVGELRDSPDCNIYQLKSMIEEEFSFKRPQAGTSLVSLMGNLTLTIEAADGQPPDGPHWLMVILMIVTSFLLGIVVRSLFVVGLQTSWLLQQSN